MHMPFYASYMTTVPVFLGIDLESNSPPIHLKKLFNQEMTDEMIPKPFKGDVYYSILRDKENAFRKKIHNSCFTVFRRQVIKFISCYENLPSLQATRLQGLWPHLPVDYCQALWKADLSEGNPGNIGDDSGREQLIEA